MIADKGYSSRKIRAYLRRRGSRGGRPPGVNRITYRHRNVVERCFGRLKQWQGLATRYDKTHESYQATVTIASIFLWI